MIDKINQSILQIVNTLKDVAAAIRSFSLVDVKSWSPVLSRFTTPAAFTGYSGSGLYVKIGRLVIAWFDIHYTGVTAAGSGINMVGGLPYPATDSMTYGFTGSVGNDDVFTSLARSAEVFHGANQIYFYSGVTQTYMDENYVNGTKYLSGHVIYLAST